MLGCCVLVEKCKIHLILSVELIQGIYHDKYNLGNCVILNRQCYQPIFKKVLIPSPGNQTMYDLQCKHTPQIPTDRIGKTTYPVIKSKVKLNSSTACDMYMIIDVNREKTVIIGYDDIILSLFIKRNPV